jgi:hypothetical protein
MAAKPMPASPHLPSEFLRGNLLDLYRRRAAVVELIRSLENYSRTLKLTSRELKIEPRKGW